MQRVCAIFAFALFLTSLMCGASSAQQVQSMKLLTQRVGWAQNGQHLYWTTDDGAHWKDIAPHMSAEESVTSVFFLDTSIGWVLLTHPDDKGEPQFRIASTSDAGGTWSTSPVGVGRKRGPDDFTGFGWMDFADRLHGWVILRGYSSSSFKWGIMLATLDGGRTWTPLGQPPIGDHFVFVTATDGWLAGGAAGDGLYATHDGGKTWQQQLLKAAPQALPAENPTYDVPIFEDSKHGFLPVTYSGPDGSPSALVLFVTDDGGRFWKPDRVLPHLQATSPGETFPSAVVGSVLIANPSISGKLKLETMAAGKITSASAEVRAAVLALSFVDSSDGWALTSNGLLATTDAGATWREITPGTRASESSSARSIGASGSARPKFHPRHSPAGLARDGPDIHSGAYTDIHLGFDTGQAPTAAQMGTWMTYSPYYDYQISLAGAANHKTNANLTASWVSAVEGQGWGLWPVWVGPQAPCVDRSGLALIQPASPGNTPYQQGQAEAQKADTALRALGGYLGSTVIYYDMENYDTSNGSCRTVVSSFLSGWIKGMQSLGYKAGVYGNVAPAVLDFSQLSPLPDDIWITLPPVSSTPPSVTIWNLASDTYRLCDRYYNQCTLWSTDQRIRQYLIQETETWAEVPIPIDADIVDADVAYPSAAAKTYSFNLTPFYPDGSVTDAYGINNIGTANGSYGGFINGSGTGEVGQILDSWQAWYNGYFEGAGNLMYNPDTLTFKLLPNYPNNGQCGNAAYCSTVITGVNNAGWVVGYWTDSNQVVHGALYNGSWFSIDYAGGMWTFAAGIDDAGLIVGYYLDADFVGHGFLYNGNTLQFVTVPIDYPGADGTYPLGINGDAQIVGYYWDGASQQGFLNSNGNFSGEPISCGPSTVAQAINNNGEIVGYEGSEPLLYPQGFSYLQFTCTALNYPQSFDTQAFGVNDAGQISGSWDVANDQAYGFVAVPQTP